MGIDDRCKYVALTFQLGGITLKLYLMFTPKSSWENFVFFWTNPLEKANKRMSCTGPLARCMDILPFQIKKILTNQRYNYRIQSFLNLLKVIEIIKESVICTQ